MKRILTMCLIVLMAFGATLWLVGCGDNTNTIEITDHEKDLQRQLEELQRQLDELQGG